MQFTQLALFQISIQHALHVLNAYLNIMESELTFQKILTKSIAKTVKCFLYQLRNRWNNCGRFVDYFKTQNSEWLDKDLTFGVAAKTFFAQHSNTTVDTPALDMSEVPNTSQGSEGTSAPERPGMAQQKGTAY